MRSIRSKYRVLRAALNERQRRLWAATEAKDIGRSGIAVVAEGTGLSRTTIRVGVRELRKGRVGAGAQRIRRAGAGRKPVTHHNPDLPLALDMLIEPSTRGDPESPLRWTCKSTRRLADELTGEGHAVSRGTVARLLKDQEYSLQANRKTIEGRQHPDRNTQFLHINKEVKSALRHRQPAISVDTKKKEIIGPFKNGGREWHSAGKPEAVRVHDFIDPRLGKVIPYGVYDIGTNHGWVNVGIDHDTADFAVESIRRWWLKMGKKTYPQARELTITADCGGSNGYRSRAWKVELQSLADRTGLRLRVCHFPPGTSKWNKIEHRLFSFITQNWRGKPLVSRQTVVALIGNTRTTEGLRVRAELDINPYPKGRKITDEQLAQVRIRPHRFHGEWNYDILPRY